MDSDLDKLRALISGWRHTVKPITQVRVTGWAGSQWFQYATDLGKANCLVESLQANLQVAYLAND